MPLASIQTVAYSKITRTVVRDGGPCLWSCLTSSSCLIMQHRTRLKFAPLEFASKHRRALVSEGSPRWHVCPQQRFSWPLWFVRRLRTTNSMTRGRGLDSKRIATQHHPEKVGWGTTHHVFSLLAPYPCTYTPGHPTERLAHAVSVATRSRPRRGTIPQQSSRKWHSARHPFGYAQQVRFVSRN